MQRNIFKVAKRIQNLLPESYIGLKQKIDEILDDARYKAPEQMQPMWVKLCEVLSMSLPDPFTSKEEWVQKISRIIRAEE